MHPAVELLAKRMESNPDEFVQGHERHHRWERIIEKYIPHMNDEDKTVIRSKYDTLQLDQMHKEVMVELLYGEEPRNELTFEKLKEVADKLTKEASSTECGLYKLHFSISEGLH